MDIKTAKICRVVSVDDEVGGGRIKVRMNPEDNRLSIKELPYCIPAMPKMVHVKPKVGEGVLVFTLANSSYSQRLYLGPVISQLNHMEYDEYDNGGTALFRAPYVEPEINEKLKPDTEGCYPNDDDVCLLGRKYSDIQLTENDVRLRAGVKLPEKSNSREVHFNEKNSAFIKLKYNEKEQTGDNKKYNSVAAVVADNVLLLGNTPKDGNIITADRQELLTDEKINELINKAHEIPYGDKLVEFLIMFRDAFLNHVHPFPTMSPCLTQELTNLKDYNLDDTLSNSIRIT